MFEGVCCMLAASQSVPKMRCYFYGSRDVSQALSFTGASRRKFQCMVLSSVAGLVTSVAGLCSFKKGT